ERTARLGILRVRPIQLNACGFELLAERFEVLHIKSDMVEYASFGRDGSTVCLAKSQVHARYIRCLVLTTHARLRAERLRIPVLNLRYFLLRHEQVDVMVLDWKLLVFVFENFDAQSVGCHHERLIRSAGPARLYGNACSFPFRDRFLSVGDDESNVVHDGAYS